MRRSMCAAEEQCNDSNVIKAHAGPSQARPAQPSRREGEIAPSLKQEQPKAARSSLRAVGLCG